MSEGIDIHTGYLHEKTLRILSELEMLEGEWPSQQLNYVSATWSLNYIADKAQNIIDECEKLKRHAERQHAHSYGRVSLADYDKEQNDDL